MDFRNRETRKAAGLLQNFLSQSGLNTRLAEKEVLKRWRDIAGDGIAAFVELVDAQDGVLLLRTSNSAWKTELYLQKKMILAKANQVMQTNCFKDIRFI